MSDFAYGDRVRVSSPASALFGREGNIVLRRDHAVNVRLDGDGRNSTSAFGIDEIELIEVPAEAIDPDVTTLRAAAAQARAEGQEHNGPSRKAMFNFASMLMNEADKVESGDRGTLPPVLASARAWLDGAVDAR